ncbi:hypothetical protein KY360_06980 [Candidatus Woesearchaeota archaeon]|nr:hypothetical protein [Candidatus Woesearchaeota archaeon]
MYQRPTTKFDDLKAYISAKQDLALEGNASGPEEFYAALRRIGLECHINPNDEYLFDSIEGMVDFLTENGFNIPSRSIEHEKSHAAATKRSGFAPQYGCFFVLFGEQVGYLPFVRTKGEHTLREIMESTDVPDRKSQFDQDMVDKIKKMRGQ